MNKWRLGPPPSVGWWPTAGEFVSWWDGRQWSIGVATWVGPITAEAIALRHKCRPEERKYWARRPEYWPARSKT
jgi:hypothetical protein